MVENEDASKTERRNGKSTRNAKSIQEPDRSTELTPIITIGGVLHPNEYDPNLNRRGYMKSG